MTITKNLNTLRTLTVAVLVCFGTSNLVNAQSSPTPGQGTQQPTITQTPQQGWMWWNDEAATRDFKLEEDRMTKLRSIDERYRKDYDALGATPWTNSGYQSLTDRRNADIKGVLTPEQYQQWSRTSSPTTPKTGTKGTTTPIDPKK